ncbi:hypothetical protein BHM03_00047584 [Ensete ventricosum]|nr:hypothetical protein BHM03_00047584 [Ensete ventricosum]
MYRSASYRYMDHPLSSSTAKIESAVDFGHRRSIEGEKGKKKKKRKKKKEEEEEKKREVPPFPALSSPARRRRPHPRAIFLLREETECLPARGERSRRHHPFCLMANGMWTRWFHPVQFDTEHTAR